MMTKLLLYFLILCHQACNGFLPSLITHNALNAHNSFRQNDKSISQYRFATSKSSQKLASTRINTAILEERNTNALADVSSVKKQPQSQYDAIICGGGPAGLLSAIMLSNKYGPKHRIALVERRPDVPPSPHDETVWSDIARFYLLGIGHRGQKALKKFGVYSDFEKASVAVNGRRNWQPGKTKIEDGEIIPAKKDVVSRILPRDKLVGVLYHHLLENYIKNKRSNIDLLYGFEATPTSFGIMNDKAKEEDVVTVRLSRCEEVETQSSTSASTSDETSDNVLCDVDSFVISKTKLLIGADGSARTVANSMEQYDAERISRLNRLWRPFAKRNSFRVTRYVDDNPRVYKSVPILLPKDWPCDLNYSARSSSSRITLEALPSDDKGNLCALLLMKPNDELAQGDVDPTKLRSFFNEEFPQFGALIDDEEMEKVAKKTASSLPAFRYAGPRLNLGGRTLILGDAAHTVKPYYGLGANSALEDVVMLSDALDDATTTAGDNSESVPKAVKLFSDRRAGDAQALVTISRNMDRPGKRFFFNFVLPLILDGMFHKIAPKVFGPNMFGMFQRQDIGFKQIQRKKRLDRTLQFACLGGLLVGMGYALKSLVGVLARLTGKSHNVVISTMAVTVAMGSILKRYAANSVKSEQ